MGRFDRDGLRAVHGGAAAETQDNVGVELARRGGAGADLVGRRIAPTPENQWHSIPDDASEATTRSTIA